MNDKDSPIHNQYRYGEKGSVAAAIDYKRSGGRLHAGRDLNAPYGTDIVAISDGVVKSFQNFYNKTHALVVHHKTTDGREFIVRYGEVDSTFEIEIGQVVKQGDIIGRVGRMSPSANNWSYSKNKSIETNMLHFELFTGLSKNGGFENISNLTISTGIYKRRDDLIDPLEILQEGYNNTFK